MVAHRRLRLPTSTRRSNVVGPGFGHGLTAFPSERHLGGSCRVCGGEIARGELALLRAWGAGEKAHVRCGWLRADEGAPHKLAGAEAPDAWEWACPRCGRDVVRNDLATSPEDGLCRACATDL